MAKWLEGILQTFCLRGIESRREYFAKLARDYVDEAISIIQTRADFRGYTLFEIETINADYHFARKCEGAARRKLTGGNPNHYDKKRKIMRVLYAHKKLDIVEMWKPLPS